MGLPSSTMVGFSATIGYPLTNALNLQQAAFPIGDQIVQITRPRSIGDMVAQVTLEEIHSDELVITEHPIEVGARVADHAYMLPSEVMIRCGWSSSPGPGAPVQDLTYDLIGGPTTIGGAVQSIQDIYADLLDMQRMREPIIVFTGKRVYNNMLIKSLRVATDKESEFSLQVMMVLRQVMIVSTQVVSVDAPADAQSDPEKTAPPANRGQQQVIPGAKWNGAGAGRGG